MTTSSKKTCGVVSRVELSFLGLWARRDGEPGREFLKRMHEWSSPGCLICVGNPALGEDGFASTEAALEFWYSL